MPKSMKILVTTMSLLIVSGVGRATAKLCGDDVDGQDVPCACGDTVVSTVALGDSDPVVAGVCPSDALFVRAPEGSAALTIDLSGKTLRGKEQGAGIWLLGGGSGGAQVISTGARAEIIGFQDGVLATGENTVALIEDVSIRGSARDGIRVTAPTFVVRKTAVSDCGRDGYSLDGKGYTVLETTSSDNGRFGYFLKGQDGVIGRGGSANVAAQNGDAGFSMLGAGLRLTDCSAGGNGKAGITARGEGFGIEGCRSEGNRGDGVTGTGSGWIIAATSAINNEGDGIRVRGNDLVDGGKNRGAGNTGGGSEETAVQCEIGGTDCVP